MRIIGKGKCKLIATCAIFGKEKCKFIANFSATMVTSLPSISLSLSLSLSVSLSLSLSLSSKLPHAQYRKRFRASYNIFLKTLASEICSKHKDLRYPAVMGAIRAKLEFVIYLSSIILIRKSSVCVCVTAVFRCFHIEKSPNCPVSFAQ